MRSFGVPFSLNWGKAVVGEAEEVAVSASEHMPSSKQLCGFPNASFAIELVSSTISECSLSGLISNGNISLVFPTGASTESTSTDATAWEARPRGNADRRCKTVLGGRGGPSGGGGGVGSEGSARDWPLTSSRTSTDLSSPRSKRHSFDSCDTRSVEETTRSFVAFSKPTSVPCPNTFHSSRRRGPNKTSPASYPFRKVSRAKDRFTRSSLRRTPTTIGFSVEETRPLDDSEIQEAELENQASRREFEEKAFCSEKECFHSENVPCGSCCRDRRKPGTVGIAVTRLLGCFCARAGAVVSDEAEEVSITQESFRQ